MSLHFLTEPAKATLADLPHIRALQAGGAVRARLPAGHPLREVLRPDAVQQAVRHTLIRADVQSLVALWQSEGIPALLIKGFMLAEFEYPSNSERFYGDVDVVLPEDPALLTRAVHLALAHGWRTDQLFSVPERWKHEVAHLHSPSGQTRIDLHRLVVAYPHSGISLSSARMYTQLVWQQARLKQWGGVQVRIPAPKDLILIHLVLARFLGDRALKPADYFDVQQIMHKHQLVPAELAEYAEQLGLSKLWQTHQALCDPAVKRLVLAFEQVRPLITRSLQQTGFDYRPALLKARARALWRVLPLLPSLLGDIAVAMWAVRVGGDPRAHLQAWDREFRHVKERHIPYFEMAHLTFRTHFLVRLLHPRQKKKGICLPRAYATYRVLKRRGHAAVFVSGVAATKQGIVSHAWIEDERGSIESYGEMLNRLNYRVLFQHPAPADSAKPASDAAHPPA